MMSMSTANTSMLGMLQSLRIPNRPNTHQLTRAPCSCRLTGLCMSDTPQVTRRLLQEANKCIG